MAQQVSVNLMEGYLHKRGKLNKGWKERFFVLTSDLKLKYYESKSKASEAEMVGNDNKITRGIIDLLKIEILKVALFKDCFIPKYVQKLMNVKQSSANNSGKNNENGSINNIRSYIIHLCLKHRTYVLSANTSIDFKSWLNIFYKYVYGGIIYESNGYKEGEKNKSFKKRYFVINKYAQIKYFDNESRSNLKGFIDLNDIHSFNIEDIQSQSAPTEYLMELNGLKRTWTLCFGSSLLLKNWCKELEKLKLKTAKKCGDEYLKQDVTFFSDNDSGADDIKEGNEETKKEEIKIKMELVRNETVTENILNEDDEGEYCVQFKINVDGIELYKNENLEDEIFDYEVIDKMFKGKIVSGKFASQKVVELSNHLFCSVLAVEEMGHIVNTPGNTTPNNLKYPSVSISHLDI